MGYRGGIWIPGVLCIGSSSRMIDATTDEPGNIAWRVSLLSCWTPAWLSKGSTDVQRVQHRHLNNLNTKNFSKQNQTQSFRSQHTQFEQKDLGSCLTTTKGSGALHWEAWATTLGPFKNWRVGSELPCEGKGWTVVLGCVVSLSYIRRRDRGVTSNVMRGPRKKNQKTIPTVWIVLHWLLDLWDPFLWWDFPQLLAWADADKLQPVFFPFFFNK